MDRENVIKGLEELEGFLFKEYTEIKAEESKIYYDRFKSLSDAIDMLKEQEAVEGHWIPIESPTGVEAFGIKEMTVQDVRCSICDAEEDVSFAAYRFCPRCGAKMEGR